MVRLRSRSCILRRARRGLHGAQPATLFRMASHSKLFTATAIMQLRDAGKIHLDDQVSTYLPWFRIQPASDGDPGITIEELLTHSSGLPREAGPHWSELSFPDSEG